MGQRRARSRLALVLILDFRVAGNGDFGGELAGSFKDEPASTLSQQ